LKSSKLRVKGGLRPSFFAMNFARISSLVFLIITCLGCNNKQSEKQSANLLFAIDLTGLDGRICHILPPTNKKACVILFLSPDCPLCQSYTPLLRKLYHQYQEKGFGFDAIFPGALYSPSEISAYRSTGELAFECMQDKDFKLTRWLKATVTPEVFVTSDDGKILYQGRIDNWAFETGKTRLKADTHELEDILARIDAGKEPDISKTDAVGCLIESK
jgi:hypothetical protein